MSELTKSFEEFKKLTRETLADPRVKIEPARDFSDFDIAVLYAVCKIGGRKGYPCEITIDEIWQEMPEPYRTEDHT